MGFRIVAGSRNAFVKGPSRLALGRKPNLVDETTGRDEIPAMSGLVPVLRPPQKRERIAAKVA